MSSYKYLPNPPRVWSRVQNLCTYDISDGSQSYIPLTKKTVLRSDADYEYKLLYKGNILQYKKNSCQLTKQQKYSQLAKCFGPNRKKVFATQSETYTNPNSNWLERINYVTIPFPNTIVGEPNNISGPFQYNVKSPFNCLNTSVQDGGNLVCGTYSNQCTGEVIKKANLSPVCFPSNFSDVPGYPIDLCWNPKIQTWFPKKKYKMNNSGTKWPINYKNLVSAIIPAAPDLYLDASLNTSITLSWIDISNNCIPISSYNIYQNNIIYKNVSYIIKSITINDLNKLNKYSFYIKSVSRSIESASSNIINWFSENNV